MFDILNKFLKILIILAIVALILFVSYGFLLNKMGKHLYYKDELKPADVIVVLKGEDAERIEHAVKLFKEGWARKDVVIFSGGHVVWRYTWASLMQEHALSLGLPKNSVLLEEKSINILQSAQFTKDMMKKLNYKSCILVTSVYQSKRAGNIFREIMGEDIKVISSSPVESNFNFEKWWKKEPDRTRVIDEYFKFLGSAIFGIQD
ncbi:MAG: YdcF family protein [Nitrospiraceae bacterium]|nr:YdcF family protein [Nitrospiraceae bacterium]